MTSNYLYKSVPLNKIILDSTNYNTNDNGTSSTQLGFCNDVNQKKYKDLTKSTYYFISTNAFIACQNMTGLNTCYNSYFSANETCAYYEEYTATDDINGIPKTTTHTISLTAQQKTCFSKINVLLIGAGGSGGAGGGDTNGRSGTNGAAGGGGGTVFYQIDLSKMSNINSFKIIIGPGGAPVSGGSNNNGNDGNQGEDTTLEINKLVMAVAGGGGGGGGGHPSSSATPGSGGQITLGDGTIENLGNAYGGPLSVSGLYSGLSNGYASNDSTASLRSLNGYYAAMNLSLKTTTPVVYWYPQLQNVMTSQTYPYGKGGAGTSGGGSVNNTPTTRGGKGYVRVYYML
jgi:hypothetical protein